jgi:chromosome segregation ATPase
MPDHHDHDARFDERIFRELQTINRKLDWLHKQITTQGVQMSKELDDLTAEVAADTAIESSAVKLIQGLAAQIAAAGTDPVALKALTDSLTTSSTALAAAVTANTPAPAPAPSPAP